MEMGERLLRMLHKVTVWEINRQQDTTIRTGAVFLSTYTTSGPHTVREMAAELQVNKPAITRALDNLEKSGLIVRSLDRRDRRIVHANQTAAGLKRIDQLRLDLKTAFAATELR